MADKEVLLESTESYLKSLISEVANVSMDDKGSSIPFQELGIDSFRVLQVIKKLEEEFGTLPKTLLFENFNISDLSHYFVDKHEQVLQAKFASKNVIPITPAYSAKKSLKSAEVVSGNAADKAVSHGKETSGETPILILEKEAYKDPDLGQLIKKLFNRYKNEGSASRGTRNIAPWLFIGKDKRGYFNYSRSRNIILVYAYTGPREYFPVIAAEIYQYSVDSNLELTIFAAEQIHSIGNVPFYATPFGVVSRVLNIKGFTLQGNKMRRLRYLVSKFEAAGKCKTEEYQSGSNKEVDKNIANLIDQWCAPRTMVNPLIHIVKEEILAGSLSSEHRLFLTYLDEVLQNVILISSLSQEDNGYLMDLEFYPDGMPLGGLEFSIVKIIEILAAEGCNVLSMGGTYGCKLAPSSNADPELDKTLNYLREQNIFNDEGNLQFKNKFRPENNTIYLCRAIGKSNPDNVIDIIMMIADPLKMQTSAEEHHSCVRSHQQPAGSEDKIVSQNTSQTSEIINSDKSYQQEGKQDVVIDGVGRSVVLSDFGYNPLNIPVHKVELDLKTDSWAQLEMPAIQNQIRYLYKQLQQSVDVDKSLRSIFPFAHFVLTTSGNTAEHAFFKGWSKKGIVPQNLLFPTTILNQIDNGFTPKELPHPDVFKLDSEELYKGNLDWEALEKQVEQDAKSIAFVLIELDDNAAGGACVSMQHLRKVKELLSQYSIPLVIDGTRVVENAHFIIRHEKEFAESTIWDVIREIFSFADAVLASLTKDFCVNKGGLIATNDANLFNTLQHLVQNEGIGLDVIDRKVVGLALQDRSKIETQVSNRIELVRFTWRALSKHGIPIVKPAGGHCILIDVKRIQEFAHFKFPVASFVAWLFLNTGIRGGAHNAGMQKGTSINSLVRLAIPVGSKKKQIEEAIDKLILLFKQKENIPEIILESSITHPFGDISAKYRLEKYHNPSGRIIQKAFSSDPQNGSVADSKLKSTEADLKHTIVNKNFGHAKDIAIVGIAGRYPKAKNVRELWENLIQGRDCIGEMPGARFGKRIKHGFTERYRGGFLEDVDKFDSLFFNISPREAEIMDPQERLFLEVAWEAIEDAGYYPEILADENSSRNIGVFVGAVWAMYQMIGVDEKLAGNKVNPNSFLWSIANRVSYWMNFSGPSLTVDTACSSSLTALYLACEAIYKGDCTSAIVGGVNLDLHQSKFDINSAGGALSKDGVCRTFGHGANGYVAGEGVGAIFLKPLDRAICDGDNIYGVIKSAAINHGGRSSGYMVTNPKAQTNLILSALENADIDARSIGYIEAHGTGTELGDPIEISGLTNAFRKYQVKNQSCPIGSVKTNIGHLEAAAGIVGLSKILLQMKHGRLVPSLHSSKLNEFIDFDNSPFYVVQNLEKWIPKEVDGIRYPLRAGISSFGAGGANAHIVVEKYEAFASGGNQEILQPGEQIFPLSARSEDQLGEMAARLIDNIHHSVNQTDPASPLNLSDIAYTLQVGRKSFDHRLAIIAKTHDELVEKLAYFIKGKRDENILVGHKQNADGITKLLSRKEKEEFIKMLSQSRDIRKMAQLWTDGLLDDWQGFKNRNAGRRISLPTYPFADKRHWVSTDSKIASHFNHFQGGIHPLIDSNESTFERQIFKKTFHSANVFIHNYRLSNRPTLCGVAFLEMARKAGEIAAGRNVHKIRNMLWLHPLTVESTKQIEALIQLKLQDNSVELEIFSEGEDRKKEIYAQGELCYSTRQEINIGPEFIDLESIQSRCTKKVDGNDIYPFFKSLGLHLDSDFQLLKEVFKGENEILGVLKVPDQQRTDLANYLLYPPIIDGSLQTIIGAESGQPDAKIFVPYSMGEVEILFPLHSNCFSYIQIRSDANFDGIKADVVISDEEGKVLLKIRDYIAVPLNAVHKDLPKKADSEGFAKLFYCHAWEQDPVNDVESYQHELAPILLFDTDEELRNLYQKRLRTAGKDVNQIILIQPGNAFEELGDQTYRINPKNAEDYTRLLESIRFKKRNIARICYAWSVPHLVFNERYLTDSLEIGVYSFLFLCQSLIEQKLEGKLQMLYVYLGKKDDVQPHHEAINGFAKVLQLEHPKLFCKTVEIQQERTNHNAVLDAVLTEFHPAVQGAMTVRYEEQVRHVRKIKKYNHEEITNSSSSHNSPFKENGVYLITGGAGGLGLIFAESIAKQCKAILIITGRSELSAERRTKLEEIRRRGGEVHYVPKDVSKHEDVKDLVNEIKSRFGSINGVIHSAGVLRDSFIRNKTVNEMEAVLASKVYGTVYLDEETKNEKLDFFVMFSSLAAVSGNLGQCDYSFANHFMDSFSRRRDMLRAKGQRSGRTLSINWSLWADGGMQVDNQTEILLKNLGMKPLDRETGIEAFVKGLSLRESQLVVVEGVQQKIEIAWGIRKRESAIELSPASDERSALAPKTQVGDEKMLALVQTELSQMVKELLKLEASDFTQNAVLTDLGFDSIGLTTYANEINKKYQIGITPVLFYEYPSIKEIARYIILEHKDEVLRFNRRSGESTSNAAAVRSVDLPSSSEAVESFRATSSMFNKKWAPVASDQDAREVSKGGISIKDRFVNEPIAIVGMSGVMPQSEDLEEFWENLRNARDMVSLIPKDRWNWEDYFGDPVKEENKSNSKWGGFMKEVDKFDAMFFGISPKEAVMMDPQQRIFLQTVWKTIEDSGHKVSDLSGTRTGLFVGASLRDYSDLFAHHQLKLDGYSASGNTLSILANRVSYLLNLRGPSVAIDTACSSSLVALNRAIESIHTGSSDMAIVGGVQVVLTPAIHISLGAAGVLSSEGKCRSFDKRANGFVRGEGSGAILIKPLSMAEADGDHIYAVIKSVVENHGGRVTALTAPNPNAQSELLIEAYEKARIDPSTVNYIECHGTGTSLGDAIEIEALKKAFIELNKRNNRIATGIPHCGLSTVKTNIGHLESAAGIAGLLKVLLALKHKQIPGLINFEEVHPYISLKGSPFYIVDKTIPWEVIKGEDGELLPRRAGVSSFGFGGSNAHVILEEYLPKRQSASRIEGPRLVILSAKNKDRLKAYAQSMLTHIERYEVNLVDFAYTLQVGRDAMEERLGLVVNTLDQLAEKLRFYIAGKQNVEDVFQGQVNCDEENLSILNQDDDIKGTIVDKWIAGKQFSKLLDAWVKGLDFDWNKLYGEVRPKRINLPTYPFAKERYWIDITKNGKPASTTLTTAVTPPSQHNGASAISVMESPVQAEWPSLVASEDKGMIPARIAETFEFSFENENNVQPGSHAKLSVREKAQLFVKQLFASQVKVYADDIDLDFHLLELGITSMDMAEMTQLIKDKIDPGFSPTAFFECTTLRSLAALLCQTYKPVFEKINITRHTHVIRTLPDNVFQHRESQKIKHELSQKLLHLQDAESDLPFSDVKITPVGYDNELRSVLLTGATGFLGVHILAELLNSHTQTRIYCLVRATDEEHGMQRLLKQAEKLEVILDKSRISVLCGDIEKPHLGLGDAEWDLCSRDVQQIIHASAHVNHIEGYATFRSSAQGMKEIVRLAGSHKLKPIHFVSSIAACTVKKGDTFSLYEKEEFIEDGTTVFGGYGQSKWVQETLLKRANQLGIPYAIYRFGELSGSSQTGLGQTEDMMHRLLQMRLAIGCREKISNDVIDMIPVDFAAKLIVNTAKKPETWNTIIHATHLNPYSIFSFYEHAEEEGLHFDVVTRAEYVSQCYDYVKYVSAINPVHGFVLECVLRDAEGSARNMKMVDGYFALLFPFDQDNFKKALMTTGLVIPEWKSLLTLYFKRWNKNESGFMSRVRDYRKWKHLSKEQQSTTIVKKTSATSLNVINEVINQP